MMIITLILLLMTQNYMFFLYLVTLSARDNQKLSKLLSKGFERSISWNEYKANSENKNMTNEFRYFLKSNFAGEFLIFHQPLHFPGKNLKLPFIKGKILKTQPPFIKVGGAQRLQLWKLGNITSRNGDYTLMMNGGFKRGNMCRTKKP